MENLQIENVRKFALEAINSHPQHKQEIKQLWVFMLDEIENGESISNECNLCIQSISDLLI